MKHQYLQGFPADFSAFSGLLKLLKIVRFDSRQFH